MTTPHRIFGSELSPYSVKVRSYFRYKQIPHRWTPRDASNMAEFQKYAKLPLIPLVVTPEEEGLQDSTPILERFEAQVPEPPIHPSDPALAFLSALIEEYADEWVNKPMFHYRWTYEADRESASLRIARENLPGASREEIEKAAAGMRERMVPRLSFVGSSPQTAPRIEASLRRLVTLLDAHLADRPYLFGHRPALADFGLFAQLYECSTDPTPGAILRAAGPRVIDWILRMLDPKREGDFDGWAALEPTLAPLLAEEIAGVFLPWSRANARALAAGQPRFSVELEAEPFSQETQKYHAKSLRALRARYEAAADRAALDRILEQTGCRALLAEV